MIAPIMVDVKPLGVGAILCGGLVWALARFDHLARKSQFQYEIAISTIASILFLVFSRVMLDPFGKRVILYALICNFIVWVLVYFFVLAVR
jgi:hypothetical protein